MKKHIPNFLTSCNLLIGAIGIYFMLTINHEYAFYFVILAAVFDFLDGFAARLLKVKSAFGKELDSLSDLVSFGLLPAFFMLVWLESSSSFYIIALLIAVFSALRLAKFNLDDSQSFVFKGLPTPANAIMLTSLVFLDYELGEAWLLSIVILSCVLLVVNIPLIALKFEHYRLSGNEWKWLLIVGGIGLLIVFKWTFLPFLIPFYLLLSILSQIRSIKSEKT